MPTIKMFCYKIECYNADYVTSIENNQIDPADDALITTIKTSSVNVTETANHVSAGTLVEQKLDAVIKHPTTKINEIVNPPLILKLSINDGSVRFFGSVDKPAYYNKDTGNINKMAISITRQTTKHEFVS